MQTKTVEIRDAGTFIPAIAIRLGSRWTGSDSVEEAERYLVARAGFGTTTEKQGEYVILVRLAGQIDAEYDRFLWGTNPRTMHVAHQWLLENLDQWDRLPEGAVIDVEYILGEREHPKVSERVDALLGD